MLTYAKASFYGSRNRTRLCKRKAPTTEPWTIKRPAYLPSYASLAWARKMLHLARAAEPPTGLPLQIQALSLGRELAIVGLSHEPFGEYQRFLQHESPFPHTLVFGYTNGCESYVPTADAYYLQGYESFGAQRLFGVPRLLPCCERRVKETGLEILSGLWQQADSLTTCGGSGRPPRIVLSRLRRTVRPGTSAAPLR